MKVIEITEIEVKAALDVAKSEEVKNVLVALFCKGEKKPTPTLDDYTTIRSYEDACAALKCSPIDEKALRSAGVRKGIIALIKLETISRALWGKNYRMQAVAAVSISPGLLCGLREKSKKQKGLCIFQLLTI